MLAFLLADVLPLDRNFDFSPEPGPYIALFGLGFLVAIVGHIAQIKTLIATGLLMIFLATTLLPLAVFLTQG